MSNNQFLKLEVGDYDIAKNDAVVDIAGLGPCTGVLIYSSKLKEAFAGHFPDCEDCNLEMMVNDALAKFGGPNGLEVFAMGCSLYDDAFDPEYEMRDRIYVPKLLNSYGFDNEKTIIRWTPENTWARFLFYLNTGKNEFGIDGRTGLVYRGDIKDCPQF